LLQNDVNF